MTKDNDLMRCVVMGRDRPSHDWNEKSLICITERMSIAWRSAHAIQKQERGSGNPKYEAVVLAEKDFESGRFRCRLKPPAGFNLELPEGPPSVTELLKTTPTQPTPPKPPKSKGKPKAPPAPAPKAKAKVKKAEPKKEEPPPELPKPPEPPEPLSPAIVELKKAAAEHHAVEVAVQADEADKARQQALNDLL